MFQQILNSISSVSSTITNQGAPSTFKFQILEKQVGYRGLYELYSGKPKGPLNIPGISLEDGAEVSIFVFKKTQGTGGPLTGFARNAMRRIVSIRHPSVVRVLDSAENESGIFIATEHVVSLTESSCITTLPVYGVYELLTGLHFLHTEAKLVHGNLDPAVSIFVTDSGNLRLGGFELCRQTVDSSYIYDRQELNVGMFRRYSCSDFPKVDLYGLVLVVYYLEKLASNSSRSLHHVELPTSVKENSTLLELCGGLQRSSTGFNDSVDFQSFVQDVMSAAVSSNAESFDVGRYRLFQRESVRIMEYLQTVHTRPEKDSAKWLDNLASRITTMPSEKEFLTGPLLSILLHQVLSIQPLIASAVPSIMLIASLMESEQFKRTALKKVLFLFSVHDRSVRFRLLSGLSPLLPLMGTDLSSAKSSSQPAPPVNSIIENKVLMEVLTGLTDSHPSIREATMKALADIAKYVSESEIEKKIVPNIIKLLRDPESVVRTNAIICAGKVVANIGSSEEKQFSLLGQCIMSGLKDSYTPAKSTALQLLGAVRISSQAIAKEIAGKFLPLVVALIVDSEADVAINAFTLIEQMVPNIKLICPPSKVQQQPPVTTTNREFSTDTPARMNSALSVNSANTSAPYSNNSMSLRPGAMRPGGASPSTSRANGNSPQVRPIMAPPKTVNTQPIQSDSFDSFWDDIAVPVKPVVPMIAPKWNPNASNSLI